MNEQIVKLLEFIQSTSPVIWNALVRQVYSDALTSVGWGVLLIAACYIMFKMIEKINEDLYRFLFYIIIFVFFSVSAMLFTTAIQKFVNPTFYALQLIFK